jgi:NADPH2:quinone reductase
MRAIRFRSIGEPEVLSYDEEVPEPTPPPGGVVVRVRAAGVNFADTRFRRGTYFQRPRFPQIPGMELAGEVVALGDGASGVAVGDRVMGFGQGSYAELAPALAAELYPIPDGLDFATAAALPVQGLTAHHLLGLAGRLAPGERVLVHAAAGGVGTLAVQLARRLGAAQVLATAGSADKLALARELGADVAIDYTTEDVFERVKAATGGALCDLVLEMLGGTAALERNLRCLGPFGRMVVFGAATGDIHGTVEPIALMPKNQSVIGYYLTPLVRRRDLCAPPLAALAGDVAAGRIRVVIGARLPLGQAIEAHRRMEARGTVGKIILEPEGT